MLVRQLKQKKLAGYNAWRWRYAQVLLRRKVVRFNDPTLELGRLQNRC